MNYTKLKAEGRPQTACLKAKLKRAFTLLEMVVTISLSLLLIGSLYSVYLTSYKSYRRSVNKAELNQNARIALERISRDLRQTERITTSLPPDDTDDMNPAPSAIQFQDGHDTENIQYIKYLLSGNELRRQIIYYCFSATPETCPPADWVAWNAQDQYGDPPSEWIDPNKNVIKADKISSIKFYGIKLITTEIVAEDADSSYTYKTQILGRNIQ
ncbi:hypothetical protein A2V71_01730 [Candidatus Berkelbacteria bacterium RBG_13_40_8]|uniref:Type II secretion system protein J n=1 Tax=Candidatus Berkelbacteria bacterium RBG_13_40_8 TaxID=1797467 RepID=A0A1F5DQ17_9BACT|nr:MAG: hypothetical protein A2V71_01730 [Candidatus Berkelbacteria bacterium RBG_13_40_8]